MQITIEIPDAIVQRIQPHWTNLAQKLLELLLQSASQAGLITAAEADAIPLEQSIELTPDQRILQDMDKQALLYEQQRHELLTRYNGQYIVFQDGVVLDADTDYASLIRRSYAESGPRPLFIRLVTAADPSYFVRTPFMNRSS
jgi:hypothetical protein